MARQAEDISKIEDIGERLDALLDALESSSSEVARVGSALDKPLAELLAEGPAAKSEPKPTPVPEPEVVTEPEVEPEPVAEEVALDEPEASASEEPDAEFVADDTELDDGLLIEPERHEKTPIDDIDGAPVGPLNLEDELDHELESLLASGEFEDPLAEMGVDESAEPLELPDEPVSQAKAPPEPVAEARKAKLPTDEAELIGELDEQLAALAEAQLAEPDLSEPMEASESAEAPAPEPAPAVAAGPEPAPAPAPEILTRPVAPAARPKRGWKVHAERAYRVTMPVAERAMVRTGKLAVAGATRASAPLKDKPHAKQIVGWVALVHLFYAACVWTYVSLWHNPPDPQPETAQPTIVAPEAGSGS